MTDPSSAVDSVPPEEERRRWHAALSLFEALQDLAPEAREARLRAEPPAPEVRAMLERMFAAIGRPSVLDRPLSGAVSGEPGEGGDAAVSGLAGRRFGRWLLLEPLGSGGMSTVWRARSLAPPLGRIAAVKLLRPGAAGEAGRARFAREIGILAALHHPGIAAVYDAGHADDGTPWFAMALVEGETIDLWCERHAADTRTRVGLLAQAAEAAAHAHRHLVVHRDIKPANVMVDADGRVTLLDFGISRLLEEADAGDATAGRDPHTGDPVTQAFTPRYAAPEQLRGDTLTTATDVYGLGALLHRLLLGVPPQWPEGGDACRDPATLGRAADDPALRAQLRGDLGAILRKALAARAEERYPGAAELAADLAAWRAGRPVRAHPGGAFYRLRRWAGRHRLAAALAVALPVSLIAGAAGIVWQAQQARAEARAARAAEAEAERARIRAERALARAESLNGFILDLFRANAPERPQSELPTTAELLALGAQRAQDPDSAAPDVRAQMLVAIGRIHALRGRTVEADTLAERAAALAREARASAPDDATAIDAILIDALRLRGQTAAARSDFDTADAALREAEQRLRMQPEAEIAQLQLARDRGMLLARRHRYAEAAEIFARAREAARARKDVDPKLLRALDSALAVSYSTLRRHEEAEPLFTQQVIARARDRDRDGLRYAIALSNHGRNRVYLGDFAAAQRKLDEAIAIYDRLFDGPNSHRAAAYLNRSQLYARQRRFDEALADADAAGVEWAGAGADGVPLHEDPFVHANRLETLLLAERWPRLAEEAAAAIAKLPTGDDYRDAQLRAGALLAMARCETGAVAEGRGALQAARARNAGAHWTDPVIAAWLDEAQARCDAVAGDLPAALRALDAAAARDRTLPPGELGEIIRRERLAGAWLDRLDRPAEARARREAAQRHLRALSLPLGRPWPEPAE
jgi:hypothetical protein